MFASCPLAEHIQTLAAQLRAASDQSQFPVWPELGCPAVCERSCLAGISLNWNSVAVHGVSELLSKFKNGFRACTASVAV